MSTFSMQEYAGGPLPWALLESIQMFTAMGLWEPPFGCMGMHTDFDVGHG
jgi:hypothetical protein